jgi:CRP-like cAMP-binding protein
MHRLATLSPGMAFGEPALQGSEATRTAFVRADSPCVCWVLEREAIERLQREQPRVMIRLLQSSLRVAARVLSRSVSFER